MLKSLRIRKKIFNWEEAPFFVGVINVTPDSFSDGGDFFSLEAALKRASELIEEGADIIDVGGLSTRPYSEPIPEEEEIKRVIPVVKAIRENFPEIPLSIDTYRAKVAELALKSGADIVNDISAGRFDSKMVDLLKDAQVPVIIMHMQGTPKTMQVNPVYQNVVKEVKEFLRERANFLIEKGVFPENIIIDPGIGFGKTFQHNLEIIKNLEIFHELNFPILLGHSRKSFLGEIVKKPPKERDGATVGISVWAFFKKVHLLRVHKVDLNKDALKVLKFLLQEN